MFPSISDSPLYPITHPKSIAVFGASNRMTSMGSNLLSSIQDFGFEGAVYPVHPKESTVLGLTAYHSVFDLPEIPELALMVLPTKRVPQALADCGKKGIGHAIIVSGGFNEVGGRGVALQAELLSIARKYGIRFLGPNCIGVANPHHKFNSTFLPFSGHPGFVGMASQSGSFITQMFDYLHRRGLGFSTGISVGNEADTDIVDCLQHLAACPHTRVIALYIEAIRRGRAFIETARAIVPDKPIVAFYVGGSETGKQAGFSHTGALAGPDALYNGVFHQSGVIRARSMEELFDFCLVLGTCRPPSGNRVIIQTHSGGPGAAAADACGRTGLTLARLSSETLERLDAFVPHTGSKSNPVDLTFAKNPMDYFENIPSILLADGGADALLIYFLIPQRSIERALESMGILKNQLDRQVVQLIEAQCQSIIDLRQKFDKPLIGYSFSPEDSLFVKTLLKGGIPVLASPERAARTLGALWRYRQYRKKILRSDATTRADVVAP